MNEQSQQSNLAQFLIRLGQDPKRLAEYKENPQAFLAESELPQDQQDALLSGDTAKIQAALLGPGGTEMEVFVFVIVIKG